MNLQRSLVFKHGNFFEDIFFQIERFIFVPNQQILIQFYIRNRGGSFGFRDPKSELIKIIMLQFFLPNFLVPIIPSFKVLALWTDYHD